METPGFTSLSKIIYLYYVKFTDHVSSNYFVQILSSFIQVALLASLTSATAPLFTYMSSPEALFTVQRSEELSLLFVLAQHGARQT